MEKWLQHKELANYEVSNKGQVRNIKTGRIMKTNKNKKGYEIVCLREGGRQYTKKVANLVGETFIPGDHAGLDLTYKDGDRTNIDADNLEYRSRKEIAQRAFEDGRRTNSHLHKKIRNVDTGETYDSISACSKATGMSRSTIGRTVNRRSMHTKDGQRFEAVEQ